MNRKGLLIRFLFASVGMALVVGTAVDFVGGWRRNLKGRGHRRDDLTEILLSFSLKRNIASLMTTTTTSKREFFGFFNGMRFAAPTVRLNSF